MIATILTAIGELVAAALIWLLGVRYGFRRGFRSRLAGGMPPAIAKSRQLTKAFGKGIAKSARAAHRAEIAHVRKVSAGPMWRKRLEQLLFPVALIVAALGASSCDRITGVRPPAKCERSHLVDTIEVWPGDTVPTTIRVGGCP